MLFEPLLFLDGLVSVLPAFVRIILWAVASGAASMALYARLAPQARILQLKQQQKDSRKRLLAYDGEWEGARILMVENLSLSFRLIGICILPVLVATLPVIWVMYGLYERYGETAILTVGPEWMRGFDMLYLLALVIVSIAIKLMFRIA